VERAAAAGLRVDPDEAAHPAPAEDDGLGAGFCQRLGFQFLADPEHEAADFDAAQHVAVQHPAEAAEHRLLADAWSVREGSAHAVSQAWIVRHGRVLQMAALTPYLGVYTPFLGGQCMDKLK